MFERFRKFSFGAVAVSVLSLVVLGVFVPHPKSAQAIPVEVLVDVPQISETIIDKIYKGISVALKNAVVRMASYAVRKVSYDTAVWLASGGKGQTPMAQTRTPGDYLLGVANEAGGAFIEELGRGVGGLCKIPDVKVDLAVKIGLRTNFTGPAYGPQGKPNCTLTAFADNWFNAENWKSKYGADQIGKRFNATLSTDNSGLGIYSSLNEKINNRIITEKANATLERVENNGFKSNKTTGNQIKTPASLIEEQFKAQTPDKQQATDQQQLNAVLASGDEGVIPSALSLFLNTLVGSMVKNFQQDGVLPFGLCVGGAGGAGCASTNGSVSDDISEQFFALNGGGGAEYARSFFSYLKAVNIDEVASYDILSHLANCPDMPGVYNCRADDDFILALRQAESGDPVTIEEAMAADKNWLHANWKLIPPADDNGDNNDPNCYSKQYCYGNAQVLRQLRIMPLGFQLAIEMSSRDNPWTLGQVVGGFNDCGPDRTVFDPAHPFCNLIDPNWVLRAPPAKCNALVFSNSLLTKGVPDRMQDCVDVQTCVTYGKDGKCLDYGYCTREKNIWKFDAQQCSAQFATCRSFVSATGQNVSFLYRTLDSQSCTQKNAGCRAYSFDQNNGTWVTPSLNADGTNRGAFFTKVATCSANAAGCSAFSVAGKPNEQPLYIKKAPDYLKCYDATPDDARIDWPETPADLNRMRPAPECASYSGVCLADEVNCSMYSPVDGGTKIPGRFTPAVLSNNQVQWNDECSAKCVGYAAYRELPSNYSNGQSVAYIVPSSGQTCESRDEGCAAFTNLSGAGDAVEFYSYLRPCAAPGAGIESKTFVTYEGPSAGSNQNGIQLKTFTLQVNDDPNNGPIGAPKYYYKTEQELLEHNANCSETVYKGNNSPPDCRQFNDDNGNIYYRLLSQTIPVTDSCTSYRQNSPELYALNDATVVNRTTCEAKKGLWDIGNETTDSDDVCRVCFQNGEYRDGSCFYQGLPGTIANNAGRSRSCAASAETCRAYRGNAGNNIEVISDDNDTFETSASAVAAAGWGGGTLSTESTRTNEHSYQNIAAAGIARNMSAQNGESYDLTFWAKGSNSATITFGQANGTGQTEVGTVSLSDTWNYYHVGPFEYNGTVTSSQLRFINRTTGGQIFLDNVRIVRVKDLKYLVKKSLSVDASCDSDASDNLPGEALGCTAYKDVVGKPYNLVGFSYLCRENAIRCTGLLDTFNTVTDPKPQAYNVRLSGLGGTNPSVRLGGKDYSCVIQVGETSCYVDILGQTAEAIKAAIPGAFVTSTMYVPADATSTKVVYMVADEPSSCNPIDVGCTQAGSQQLTPGGLAFVTTTIKNDPATYADTLCRSEAVGCSAYSDGTDTRYFKDPAVVGQKVCTYRPKVNINGVSRAGWFWKGVGVCSTNRAVNCSADADCGAGATCVDKDVQPCYPNYLVKGEFGLWSSGNTSTYKNFVGECDASQNKCTELLDPADNNTPYYLIKDGRVGEGECSGQVSQKFGCALFNQTDNPNKSFDSKTLYSQSESQDGKKVSAPVTADRGQNDSNVILQVNRDRVCGEWLGCNYTRSVFDEDLGAFKEVCENVQRCNAGGCGQTVKSGYSNEVLTSDVYRNRKTGWAGMDYSGYSVPSIFPVEELEDVNFATPNAEGKVIPDYHLVKKIACGGASGANCTPNAATTATTCETINQECGKPGNKGWCINRSCVQTIAGQGTESGVRNSITNICRGYPEKDSPFPYNSYISTNEKIYGRANHCNETQKPSNDPKNANACECDYVKASYGDSIVKYWDFEKPNTTDPMLRAYNSSLKPPQTPPNPPTITGIPDGLCLGGTSGKHGEQVEKACSKNEDCEDGICQRRSAKVQLIGLKGYCIEEDTRSIKYDGSAISHNCLTWFPGRINGTADVFNQSKEAGVDLAKYGFNSDAGLHYCTSKESYTFVDKKKFTLRGYVDCDGGFQAKWNQYKIDNPGPININTLYDLIARKKDVDPKNPFSCYSPSENVADETCTNALNGTTYLYKAKADQLNRFGDGGGYCEFADEEPFEVISVVSTPAQNCSFLDWGGEDLVTITYFCKKKTAGAGFWDRTSDVRVNYGADANRLIAERSEEWCTNVVQVAAGEDAKVRTNAIWKDTGSIPAQRLSDPCQPYGASSVNEVLADPSGDVLKQIGIKISTAACAAGATDANRVGNPPVSMFIASKLVDINFLKQMFPKNNATLGWWDPTTFGPSDKFSFRVSSNGSDVWDLTNFGATPMVRSVASCRDTSDNRRVCLEGDKGVTLFANNTFYNTGNVKITDSKAGVSLRFFAYADNDQMPLRKMSIAWGDTSSDDYTSGDPSYFRNHRGAKNGTCNQVTKMCQIPEPFYNTIGAVATTKSCSQDSECTNLDICQYDETSAPWFGLIKGKTCNAGYIEFKNHIYSCEPSQAIKPCPVSPNEFPDGCCAYQPKVYLEDNWGHCTGGGYDLSTESVNTCYQDRPTGIIQESAWVKYGDRVYVTPLVD